ncbi:unnamed protein product [Amoebophrya sp. A25]|nr:unnamed protein product [Amoebophrya sp. A25]|eukprot:GSA25T00014038001.1
MTLGPRLRRRFMTTLNNTQGPQEKLKTRAALSEIVTSAQGGCSKNAGQGQDVPPTTTVDVEMSSCSLTWHGTGSTTSSGKVNDHGTPAGAEKLTRIHWSQNKSKCGLRTICELQRMPVHEEFRRMGIGQRLVDHLEKWAAREAGHAARVLTGVASNSFERTGSLP